MCRTVLLLYPLHVCLSNPQTVYSGVIPLKSKVCWLKPAENLNSLVSKPQSMWTSGIFSRNCFGDVWISSWRDSTLLTMFCRPQLATIFEALLFPVAFHNYNLKVCLKVFSSSICLAVCASLVCRAVGAVISFFCQCVNQGHIDTGWWSAWHLNVNISSWTLGLLWLIIWRRAQ